MTPDRLDQLLNRGSHRSLEGLEQAVWDRVEAKATGERSLVRLASVQLALLVVAVVGSAVVGGMAASQAMAASPDLGVFSPHSVLTPSSRLVGFGQ
jgi:hypothetical protein